MLEALYFGRTNVLKGLPLPNLVGLVDLVESCCPVPISLLGLHLFESRLQQISSLPLAGGLFRPGVELAGPSVALLQLFLQGFVQLFLRLIWLGSCLCWVVCDCLFGLVPSPALVALLFFLASPSGVGFCMLPWLLAFFFVLAGLACGLGFSIFWFPSHSSWLLPFSLC